jgi:hypothetical protein
MPILEITRAAKFVTITNALLFVGSLISALAIPLSIRANNRVQELKDKRRPSKTQNLLIGLCSIN